jgi:predicted nicotinamide N-methyase
VEAIGIGSLTLQVERLRNLEETIDQFFVEFEKSGRADLFEELCPYFGVPWPAGRALAEYALTRLPDWRHANVLELGCGLALPSLALAAAGHRHTIASDLHPDVPGFLKRNRLHNDTISPRFRVLDWRDEEENAEFDVLIGSDLLYDKKLPAALLSFLLRNAGGKEVIIADPGRPYFGPFANVLREHGFAVEEFVHADAFFLRVPPKG